MHIKQVVVEGFKTYREQIVVEFEPHLNCIGTSVACFAFAQTARHLESSLVLRRPDAATVRSRPDAAHPSSSSSSPTQSARMVQGNRTSSTVRARPLLTPPRVVESFCPDRPKNEI